jgi:hypothetical protein
MIDSDFPTYGLRHSDCTANATFEMHAQFRQYARVQIGSVWYRCSNLELSDLKIKFKESNGKWINDGSSFDLDPGNGSFSFP